MIDFDNHIGRMNNHKTKKKMPWYLPARLYSIRTIEAPHGLTGIDLHAYAERKASALFPFPAGTLLVEVVRGEGETCSIMAVDKKDFEALCLNRRGAYIASAWNVQGSKIKMGARFIVSPMGRELLLFRNRVPIRAIGMDEHTSFMQQLKDLKIAGSLFDTDDIEIVSELHLHSTLTAEAISLGFSNIIQFELSALEPHPRSKLIFHSWADGTATIITPFIRIAFIGITALIALLLMTNGYKKKFEELRHIRTTYTAATFEVHELMKKKEAILSAIQSKSEEAPSAIRLLSRLGLETNNSITIRRISITKGKFEADVNSADALQILEVLEASNSFSDVSLRSIVPLLDGTENFSLTGIFHEN